MKPFLLLAAASILIGAGPSPDEDTCPPCKCAGDDSAATTTTHLDYADPGRIAGPALSTEFNAVVTRRLPGSAVPTPPPGIDDALLADRRKNTSRAAMSSRVLTLLDAAADDVKSLKSRGFITKDERNEAISRIALARMVIVRASESDR